MTMRGWTFLCAAMLSGCSVQGMATMVSVDGGGATSEGPPVAGPVATKLAAQLSAAGLDVKSLPTMDSLTDAQLFPVMKAFSTALGTGCDGCHLADKSADTPRKRVAKKMWDDFVRQLARKDGSPLFCDSCHQGKMEFLDRTDSMKLAAFMDSNYVDGVVRRDGAKQSCGSCHGSPFDPSFLDGWEGKDDTDGGTVVTPDAGPVDAGAGDAAVAPTLDGAVAPAPCELSINEVQTAGTHGAADEYVELYNSCTVASSLDGHKLVYRSGSGTSDTLLVALDGSTVPAGGWLVVGGASYSGTGTGTAAVTFKAGLAATAGAVALLDDSTIVDRVAWGSATNAYVEVSPAAAPSSGQSIARRPDGSHTHANASLDFTAGAPTPGAAN